MDKEKTKLAVDKVFRDMAGAMAAGMAYVGTRAGLFRAMQGKGAMALDDVVRASGMQPRYVEEWLRGIVPHAPSAPPGTASAAAPPGHGADDLGELRNRLADLEARVAELQARLDRT